MTQQMIKALTDNELSQVIDWGMEERNLRAARRKQEAIVRIKELARSVKIDISIKGTRGRPQKPGSDKN